MLTDETGADDAPEVRDDSDTPSFADVEAQLAATDEAPEAEVTEEVVAEAPADDTPWGLDRIPEDVRGDWYEALEKHVGEIAEARDAWAPYAELGVNDLDPESVGNLLAWVSQLDSDDPAAQREAIVTLAENLGIDLTAAEVEAVQEPTDPQAELQTRLDELQARLDGRDEAETRAQVEAQVHAQLETEWAEVTADYKKAYGRDLDGDDLERLQLMATRFAASSETPIREAYDLMAGIAASAQAQLAAGAPTQPRPAVRAGRASTTATPPESFDDLDAFLAGLTA